MRKISSAAIFLLVACGADDDPSGTLDAGEPSDSAADRVVDGESGPRDAGDSAVDASSCLAPGNYDYEVEVDGVAHSFGLHVPSGMVRSAVPLVIQLHGGGSNGTALDRVTGLTALADDEGFLVMTPNGFDIGGGRRVWNAGACCGPRGVTLPDHVAAISAMIDRAGTEGACLDSARIFATGHSNGGMMTYRLACELSERIAAIAVSAGTMADEDASLTPPTIYPCAPAAPVPVLHVHGLEDLCVMYDGGESAGSQNRVLADIESVIERWRQINRCGADATESVDGPVRRRTWLCDRSTVELIAVEGLGHPWGGSPIYGSADTCGGTTTTAVSTTEELWRFFSALPP